MDQFAHFPPEQHPTLGMSLDQMDKLQNSFFSESDSENETAHADGSAPVPFETQEGKSRAEEKKAVEEIPVNATVPFVQQTGGKSRADELKALEEIAVTETMVQAIVSFTATQDTGQAGLEMFRCAGPQYISDSDWILKTTKAWQTMSMSEEVSMRFSDMKRNVMPWGCLKESQDVYCLAATYYAAEFLYPLLLVYSLVGAGVGTPQTCSYTLENLMTPYERSIKKLFLDRISTSLTDEMESTKPRPNRSGQWLAPGQKLKGRAFKQGDDKDMKEGNSSIGEKSKIRCVGCVRGSVTAAAGKTNGKFSNVFQMLLEQNQDNDAYILFMMVTRRMCFACRSSVYNLFNYHDGYYFTLFLESLAEISAERKEHFVQALTTRRIPNDYIYGKMAPVEAVKKLLLGLWGLDGKEKKAYKSIGNSKGAQNAISWPSAGPVPSSAGPVPFSDDYVSDCLQKIETVNKEASKKVLDPLQDMNEILLNEKSLSHFTSLLKRVGAVPCIDQQEDAVVEDAPPKKRKRNNLKKKPCASIDVDPKHNVVGVSSTRVPSSPHAEDEDSEMSEDDDEEIGILLAKSSSAMEKLNHD